MGNKVLLTRNSNKEYKEKSVEIFLIVLYS